MVNALARDYSDWKGTTGPGAQLKEMLRKEREEGRHKERAEKNKLGGAGR